MLYYVILLQTVLQQAYGWDLFLSALQYTALVFLNRHASDIAV